MWYRTQIVEQEEEYIPPSWSTGTDEEIVEALEKHYNGEIDLTEYWSVGDERVVSLPAIGNDYVGETQPAQNVTFVILNVGGKELVTPINGHTECAFIVGLKDNLSEAGLMYITASLYGWSRSDRRSWCNDTFYNAIPSSLKSIFKQHKNYTADTYNASSATMTQDYFCLPSGKEITGTTDGVSTGAEANNTLLTYYETTANRSKETNGIVFNYWTSSKIYTSITSGNYKQRMVFITSAGDLGTAVGTYKKGIAPQGVI